MKLSKAQQEVMDQAKADIDFARKVSYKEWLKKASRIHDEDLDDAVANGYLKEYYDEERQGIVLTQCNSRTLRKLEELGLIQIIKDACGTTYGIDTVKVLNY